MKDYEQIEKDYAIVVIMNNTVMGFAQEYLDEFEQFGDARLERAWITEKTVEIEWSNNVYLDSHSSYLLNQESIPVEYLWNPDWIYDLRAAQFKANTEAVMAREAKIRTERKAADDERYQQYLKLKEEFEG